MNNSKKKNLVNIQLKNKKMNNDIRTIIKRIIVVTIIVSTKIVSNNQKKG